MSAQRVYALACRAEPGYKLWLRFADGLEGRVFLGNLLEVGAFQLWRDVREFRKGHVEHETGTICWTGGVRLDAEILWHDLAAAERNEPPQRPIDKDPSFYRFMQRAVALGELARDIMRRTSSRRRRAR